MKEERELRSFGADNYPDAFHSHNFLLFLSRFLFLSYFTSFFILLLSLLECHRQWVKERERELRFLAHFPRYHYNDDLSRLELEGLCHTLQPKILPSLCGLDISLFHNFYFNIAVLYTYISIYYCYCIFNNMKYKYFIIYLESM